MLYVLIRSASEREIEEKYQQFWVKRKYQQFLVKKKKTLKNPPYLELWNATLIIIL